jgi:hypothetical protein
MDVHFIEYYVRKKHDLNLAEYFQTSMISIYRWHTKGIPEVRIKEFIERERSGNIYELFCRIHER